MSRSDGYDRYRDTAQQMVTALLAGDRGTAGDIIAEQIAEPGFDALRLALTLADLVGHVHTKWATAMHAPVLEGWQAIAADIEEWRAGRLGGVS